MSAAKKILVIGRDGQVARALAQLNVPGLSVQCVGRPEIDLVDAGSVQATLERYAPDLVVNPAAYTAVDQAEKEPEHAFAINQQGAANIAAATASAGIGLIHFSTDYVFSGDKSAPYLEDDQTGPQGVYGASKLAGEQAVQAANPRHVILRTAWVYAPWGNNFAKTMLRLADTRDKVRVVADQQGTPSYAPDLAQAVSVVARTIFAAPDSTNWRGTFHLVNAGFTSWAEFAAEVFARSRATGGPWAEVETIGTADYPTAAKRPANSRLDTTRFKGSFGHALPDWQDGVRRFSEQYFSASQS